MDEGRVEQLERRVAELEGLVRQLAARALPAAGPVTPRPPPPPLPSPARRPVPRPASPVRVAPAPEPEAASDLEQWIGQRGLLAVGIIALLATAGFFVKYAIDQGWISPWVRVNLGALAGVGIAVWGDRLTTRGNGGAMRAYGAAIVGAGGGVAYLAVWAAATAYTLLSPVWGLVILAGITVGVASRAVHHRVEALAIWAIAGAFCAPFFVPQPNLDLSVLLAYLFVVGVGGAAVAYLLHWRWTFLLALTGYFLLPAMLAGGEFAPAEFIAYLALGGMAALVATEARRWPEARFCAFLLAWAFLIPLSWAVGGGTLRWVALAAGAALLLTVWLRHCALDPFRGEDPVEAILFVAAPLAFLIASAELPAGLQGRWEVVPLALAGLYFLPGWPRRTTSFVAMGFALLAVAVVAVWPDSTVWPVGWALLGSGAVAADHWMAQRAGRGSGLWLVPLAAIVLFTFSTFSGGAAFTGTWGRAWYVVMACAALGGYWWQGQAGDSAWLTRGSAALWTTAGVVLFLGGTRELDLFFTALPGDPEKARLMGDLAISAFWIAYAGALVRVGFWLGRQPVRAAGLGVAGLAVVKIAFYDLANLEALYRVGSFFVLAVMTLAVAYAYTQRAKSAR